MAFYDVTSGLGAINSLGSLSSATGDLLGLLLVTPNGGFQPQAKAGEQKQDAFLFHFEGEQSISLESDITDHYVEDNTAINDHIALRPEQITTHGYIGELNNVTPDLLVPLKAIAEKLTVISSYTPDLSASAIRAYNDAAQVYATAENLTKTTFSVIKTFTGGEVENQQQKAFKLFYNYWKSRTLFTVQTPWAVFPNMAIRSLRTIQDPDTNMISDFELTFKRMRFAQTIVSTAEAQARAEAQGKSLVQSGTSTPIPSIGLGDKLKTSFKTTFDKSFIGGIVKSLSGGSP